MYKMEKIQQKKFNSNITMSCHSAFIALIRSKAGYSSVAWNNLTLEDCSNLKNMQNNKGFGVLTAVAMKSSILCDVTPCSPLKVSWPFERTFSLHLQGRGISEWRKSMKLCSLSVYMLVSYSSILKMEFTYSSETSVGFQWSTWRCITEDRNLYTK
jgi:hypothetical protein